MMWDERESWEQERNLVRVTQAGKSDLRIMQDEREIWEERPNSYRVELYGMKEKSRKRHP